MKASSLRQRRNKPARKNARACGRGRESRKKRGPARESAFSEMRKSQKAWPYARIGVSGDAKASLSAASGRSGLGAGSERSRSGLGSRSAPGPLARQHRGFAGFELRGRRSILARSGADFVAGAALWQGQVNCVAGATPSQGQVQISWQAQHFRKVKYRFRGRCSTFTRSSAKFVAGASLSQGQVQISWQAQHFRKVKYRFRGRRSTFARSTFAGCIFVGIS